MADAVWVGVDVAKRTLEVATSARPDVWQVTNDEAGWAALIARLDDLQVRLIVFEATGGYESGLAAALVLASYPVAIVNPRQVRDFAKAAGVLAKTDAIDARVLAAFAHRMTPPVRPLPDALHADLRALVARRQQLQDMLTAERNRLAQARDAVHADVQAHITWLRQRLQDLDKETQARLRSSPLWRTRDQLLQSVPGIGRQTSARLIVSLPELGRLSAREIAKLVGVAPLNDDSGPRSGTRHIWGGRTIVRHALYMATVVATRDNPIIHAFYHRLRRAGKPAKVALIAAMHKLLTILNAMIKQQTLWTLTPTRTSTAPANRTGGRAQGATA